MRVAIPASGGRVSPVFDVATAAVLVDCESGHEVSRREIVLPPDAPQARVARLVGEGVEALICGAISRELAERVAAEGIRLIAFTCGSLEEVLGAWLGGALETEVYRMPGCGRQRRRAGRGRRCAAPWQNHPWFPHEGTERSPEMPRGDGTGPGGKGPGTGRGLGPCGPGNAQSPAPASNQPAPNAQPQGAGRGRRSGGGRGGRGGGRGA